MKIKENLIILTLFAALSLLVFLPVAQGLNTNIFDAGITPQDGYQHIWNLWWAKKSCLGFCGDFWNTDYLFFPDTTSLLFHNFSFFNLVVFLPFLLLGMSPVLAYNLSLMLAIMLSGYFTYKLAFYLTKNAKASIIAGLIYGLSPYLVGHIINGQLDHASIQFFPLWLLLLIKSGDQSKFLLPILAGITFFLLGTDFSFLIIGTFMWLIYFVYDFSKNTDRLAVLKKHFVSFLAFITPFLYFFSKQLTNINLFELKGGTRLNSEFFSSDFLAYFTPSQFSLIGNHINKANFGGIASDQAVYLGLGAIILSLFAILNKPKEKIYWIALVFFGFLLSLGPKLKAFNEVIFNGPMPFSIIEKIPILNILRAPSRFSVIVFIGLSILSAYGYIILEKKLQPKNKNILFALVFLFIIIETFPINMNVTKLYLPEVYKEIKEEPGDYAILEYPVLWSNGLTFKQNFDPRYMYFQTEHEKKISGGYLTRLEKDKTFYYKNYPILDYFFAEEMRVRLDSSHLEIIEKHSSSDPDVIMKENKYKYLIFNKNFDLNIEKITAPLRDNIELVKETDEFDLYRFK